MGYIFDYIDSVACETWYASQQYQRVKIRQWNLLLNLLKPRPHESIVDIGCGTGETLSCLSAQVHLQLTGIDPSPYMLDMARQKLGPRVDFHRGFAEDLPFDDNSFNHATLVTSLEFTDNPEKAIEEAARVAKDRLFIGVINRYAAKGKTKGASEVLEQSVCTKANLFSVWELKSMIRSILGNVPVSWRTVNLMKPESGGLMHLIEQIPFARYMPFGTYLGMVVTLVPKYRVKPISLKYDEKSAAGIAGGQFTTVKQKTIVTDKG